MPISTDKLAGSITKNSSLQTFYTIKLLVDKPLVNDAFKAYAYFRWIDDQVDKYLPNCIECKNFIKRQKKIIKNAYSHIEQSNLKPEEKIITELIKSDDKQKSKLNSYITNLFSIIEFDNYRKGRFINQKELIWYSDNLGKAVTDCIQYFIGNNTYYPDLKYRYSAAIAAHIIHMLRDYSEDQKENYLNAPEKYIEKINKYPENNQNIPSKTWIKNRIKLARKNFELGKMYIDQVPVLRYKIATRLYCARFELLMETIEKDNYILRPVYKHKNKFLHLLKLLFSAVKISLKHFLTKSVLSHY